MSSTAELGWKWNVDIYDKPGWSSFTYTYPHWGGIIKRDDKIVIRFDSADETTINDDFYIEHYRTVMLASYNGGLSWSQIDPGWTYNIPLVLSDGTLVEMVEARRMQTREYQKQRLEGLGLGHIWHDDCLLAWDLWPAHMTEELKRQGYNVWERQGDGTFVWLPDGVIATHRPSSLISRISMDNGITWSDQASTELDDFAHFGGCFSCGIVLPDDTVLFPFYAVHTRTSSGTFALQESQVFVLRSTDCGKTYEMVNVGGPIDNMDLSETSLVFHPSGRVIALIRGTEIHCSVSDDGGETWTSPQPTGIIGGYPLHAICLNSGNILCVYAHRTYPAGIRATLSYNTGKSWDVKNEVILRDDITPSHYIGGPGSVQLEDDTIFTYYNLIKGKELSPGRHHCYIAGSRYTEDYLGPLR